MTGDNWTTIRVRGASNSQAIIAALFALGAEGVQELDSEVVTHLREADTDAVRSAIAAADKAALVDAEPLASDRPPGPSGSNIATRAWCPLHPT